MLTLKMHVENSPFISEGDRCTVVLDKHSTAVIGSRSDNNGWVEGQQGQVTAAPLVERAVRDSGATMSSAAINVRSRGALKAASITM